MSAILSPPIVFQGLTAQGLPLIGGLLYSYIAGTSTPQATYTDSTMGTPNTNPVVLNASGQAPVWLDPTKVYKFVLTDKLGNPIGSTDQIQGSSNGSDIFDDYHPSLSLGAILYPQTPAELAAGVTPVNFGYAPGNVLRYGGDPTGVASSLIAFTSAYNVAIATLPNHGSIYIPTGKYLIPSPGLNWTTALDLHMSGDGAEQSLLVGDATGGYTILTMNAGGPGTNGVYLNLSKFGVQNNNASTAEHGLALSDYLYASLTDMKIFASGNALVMKGVANYTVTNLNCLSWENNTAGNAALVLGPDSASVNCGPGHFIGCQFEGVGAVTTGGAVSSSGTYSTTFSGCAFNANGSALVSVVEAASLDDLTFLECYSESCANTTANTADLFYLGRTLAPINITIIGGTFNSGIGGKFCNYGILGNNLGSLTLINTQWNNFVTAAVNFGFSAPTRVIAFNNISAGSGSPPMFQQAAALGGAVHFWFAPALTSGWGVPTGNTPVAGFPGATATLIQCGVAIAQIITDFKTMGIYSS